MTINGVQMTLIVFQIQNTIFIAGNSIVDSLTMLELWWLPGNTSLSDLVGWRVVAKFWLDTRPCARLPMWSRAMQMPRQEPVPSCSAGAKCNTFQQFPMPTGLLSTLVTELCRNSQPCGSWPAWSRPGCSGPMESLWPSCPPTPSLWHGWTILREQMGWRVCVCVWRYPKFVVFSAFPLLELPFGGVSALWTYPKKEVHFIS